MEYYSNNVKNNRINWIDWAKCFAITMVVYGHIPQHSFFQFYVCTFHIPLFFFISGYLTKARKDIKDEVKKCLHSLIIPYLLYNVIFYPYWAIRLKSDRGVDFSIYDYIIKPIIGVFFLQIDTPISSAVNGAMWFLAALLLMRCTLFLCLHIGHSLISVIAVSLFFVGLYVFSISQDLQLPTMFDGFLKCLPLYLLGFLTKHYKWLETISLKTDFVEAMLLLSLSVAATYIYRYSDCLTYQMFTFYIVLVSATFGVLQLCKCINHIVSAIIVNVSNGTLMIMGLHWMFIGVLDFILEKYIFICDGITYSWLVAIIIAICIDAIIYPLIVLAKKHFPMLLGK